MNIAQIVQHPNTELLLMTELSKLKQHLYEVEQKLQYFQQNTNKKQLRVFASNQHRLVNIVDIVMISAYSNYSTISLANGDRLFTSKTLKHWESVCSSSDLIRIHKSFLVNKSMIISIDAKNAEVILCKGLKAKYSRMSREELMRRFQIKVYIGEFKGNKTKLVGAITQASATFSGTTKDIDGNAISVTDGAVFNAVAE